MFVAVPVGRSGSLVNSSFGGALMFFDFLLFLYEYLPKLLFIFIIVFFVPKM